MFQQNNDASDRECTRIPRGIQNLLENLAGGDRKRLQEIGLALVGYSQAITDKQSS